MVLIQSNIEKDIVQTLPDVLFPGRTIVIDSEENAKLAVNKLSQLNKVGFDTETRPSFKKGMLFKVALVQLSTLDTCYLFRLNKIGFPDCLLDFFKNPNVLKIGLSLRDDFLSLHRRKDFTPAGFVDLQTYVHEMGIEDMSLQKIYAILFHKKISKSQRLTNWESDILDERQMIYAATDAWACLQIYNYLEKLKSSGNFKVESTHEQ